MVKLEIKSGDRYNKLTIIKEVERYKPPVGKVKRQFECECDCGNKTIVRLTNLRTSTTKSCGCWKLNTTKIIGKENTKHGLTRTRTYNSWQSMKYRCLNPNSRGYEHYGGRGITICDRWLNSFQNFLEDMGERPLGTSIDRIDVNGNYEPSNCKWSTHKQQNNNRR